ncbi:hypothetical protein SAMN04487967_2091 [Natronorubrum sediminis]|uniref:Uncharacterized protein n=1 Tax=Natronorubrum sediminis TaxID=640943 RepID=A0A1H6FXF5_9EURY|nr:hypothetical protein SAMN04487967_2091 [Natronorubrum sediminis]
MIRVLKRMVGLTSTTTTIIFECRRCGTCFSSDEESCTECGTSSIVKYKI